MSLSPCRIDRFVTWKYSVSLVLPAANMRIVVDLVSSAIVVRPAPVAGLVSVVVPVFNERESLAVLFTEIDAIAKTLVDTIEVIFVDDGSTDGSWETIAELAKANPQVTGLRFRRNFGKAAALAAGFRRAAGEIVLTMDADLQDDPAELPRFLEAIRGGQDLVSGYKQVRHDPWHKVFPSRVFNWMVSSVTGVQLHDHNCGFKAYRAAVTRELRLYGELHRYTPVLASARGFRIGELVVAHRPRKFGKSKFGWTRFAKGFLDLIQVRFITHYSRRPMHCFGTIGLLAWAGAFASFVALMMLMWNGTSLSWAISLLIATIVLTVIGGQSFLTGLVAELLLHHKEVEPYVIVEESHNGPQPQPLSL